MHDLIGQSVVLLQNVPGVVLRKKEDRVLTGRQPWELRSCELFFASVEVLHSVAAGPPRCFRHQTKTRLGVFLLPTNVRISSA